MIIGVVTVVVTVVADAGKRERVACVLAAVLVVVVVWTPSTVGRNVRHVVIVAVVAYDTPVELLYHQKVTLSRFHQGRAILI